MIVAEREGQDGGGDEEQRKRREPPGAEGQASKSGAEAGREVSSVAIGHTRVTSVRPNRPDGLHGSTPTMMTSATVSLISVPTT